MLTSDLVRLRKKGDRVVPRFLGPKERERLRPVAASYVATYRAMVGRTRGELDEALAAVPVGVRDRVAGLGLRKLCEDRAELEQPTGLDPEVVRREVFARSAAAHRQPDLRSFDRAAVLAASASALGASVEEVEAALFADLADAQVVRSFEPIEPDELLARYDLALAQAVLLRATRVVVTFREEDPLVARALFRAARFHGLLHRIEQRGGGFTVTVDGPFSLFDAVQKYGLRLALFLPHVLGLRSFELEAEVLVGKERTRAVFALDSKSGLGPPRGRPLGHRPEIEQLLSAFEALGSSWRASPSDRLFPLPDGSVLVPDVVFTSEATGEEVFLEMFGFWSRDAVWRRVEQIQAGLPLRLLLAVSRGLRVSESVLEGDDGGSSLITFGSTLSAKTVLARLEGRR